MLLLHLPMPAEPLCPTDAVEAYVAAGDELSYDPEWSKTLECESEADCRDQLATLHDPAPSLRAVRASNAAGWTRADSAYVAAYVAAPVLLRAELMCFQNGARATWNCDAAACELSVVRPSNGVTAQVAHPVTRAPHN